MKIVLADYGAGNLSSVASAFARAGADTSITVDPDVVRQAPLAVIAGVGHVESAARGLAAHGLDTAIRERVAQGRPVLGICVGMQLLFGASEEGGSGLELLDGPVRRVKAKRVPHMGWNELSVTHPSPLVDGLDGADVYFAHSYAVEPDDDDVVTPSPTTAARSWPPSTAARSQASSSTPSAAPGREPACSRTRWRGQEARNPLP